MAEGIQMVKPQNILTEKAAWVKHLVKIAPGPEKQMPRLRI